MSPSFRFAPYDETENVANVVVDGSPNASTVLTLTHWPGIAQPAGLAADLSAEMAFKYLESSVPHRAAEVATNNHFDQDGLVGLHALIEPNAALAHKDRLIDVAAAGDFATYRFRESARASMAIWAYAQPDRSPLGSQLDGPYESACALLYETVLPLLVPMIEDSHRFRDLWQDEDAQLTASENAIAQGHVTIEEQHDLDLAIVTIDTDELAGGHRFASDSLELIHPFALNNATRCCRVLIMHGHQYVYLDRYETWVQYRSRDLPRRVDLMPLSEHLEALETGAATWSASPASRLTPSLRSTVDSTISRQVVTSALRDHLSTMPPAWNPYPDTGPT